jgi:hypothetical protein
VEYPLNNYEIENEVKGKFMALPQVPIKQAEYCSYQVFSLLSSL